MKRPLAAVALIGLAAAVSGCAGPNPLSGSSDTGTPAGFWWGLVQGAICPIAFVVSLFNHGISMYEVHNNGAWYNAGFLLGAGAWGILGRGSVPSLENVDDDEIREEAERRGLLDDGGLFDDEGLEDD